MVIAGILFSLLATKKVEVIPMSRSALNFSNENNTSKPPTGKSSKRRTYLIDDGTCSSEEINHVLPYVESAEILFLAHLGSDKKWITWKPDGTPIKNLKFDPPWDHFGRAFDYSPMNTTFVVWSQKKLTPRQQNFMNKGLKEDPYTGIADCVVLTFNGVAFPVVNGREQLWDQEEWGYRYGKPPEYADIPFWIESVVEKPGIMAARVGAKLKVGKSILRFDSFRDPDDDIFPTRAQFVLEPPQLFRKIELNPVVDWTEREAKYGKQTKENKDRFRIRFTSNEIKNGVQSYEVAATTPIKNWKHIEVTESFRLVGYFGHVKTHPNGIKIPFRKIEE